MNLAGLASCRELTTEHAEGAARSAEAFRAVLARAAEIAQPEDGAPMILIVLARLARGDVAWLEGDLVVELTGDDTATTLDVLTDQGWGIREPIAPPTRFAAPLDEFSRAVELSSKRFAPLRATFTADRVILAGSAAEPDATASAEMLAIPAPIEPEPFSAPGSRRPGIATKPAPAPASAPEPPSSRGPHSRPTVRRMVAIRPEALRTGRKDPRREDDE